MSDELDLSRVHSEKLRDMFKKFHKLVFPEPPYEKFRWCEENLAEYRESVKLRNTLPTQRQTFYLAESGSVCRNDHLIQCVILLKEQHFLDPQFLDPLLEDKPLLRVSTMVERSQGSCEFIERSFDLVSTAIDCRAKDVLMKLLPYIDFSLYDKKTIDSIIEQSRIDASW